MNLIEYLSLKIEAFAVLFSSMITALFPFLGYYLDNHPEKIMIIIGFGGQAFICNSFYYSMVK